MAAEKKSKLPKETLVGAPRPIGISGSHDILCGSYFCVLYEQEVVTRYYYKTGTRYKPINVHTSRVVHGKTYYAALSELSQAEYTTISALAMLYEWAMYKGHAERIKKEKDEKEKDRHSRLRAPGR